MRQTLKPQKSKLKHHVMTLVMDNIIYCYYANDTFIEEQNI